MILRMVETVAVVVVAHNDDADIVLQLDDNVAVVAVVAAVAVADVESGHPRVVLSG